MEVFIDNYIAIAIPALQQHLNHVANLMMYAIHNASYLFWIESSSKVKLLGPMSRNSGDDFLHNG
jgi:hypothetical protein